MATSYNLIGRTLTALTVALSITLAACSPKASGRSAADDARPVLKVASQKGTTKSLVLASHVLEGAPYRVEWSEFPSAQTLLEALSAGAVDVGAVGDAPFFFAYANNPKLKVVQVYRSGGGGHAVAVVVPNGSSIKTVADLKGRKIATGKGSIGHYLVLRLLEQAHLKPSDVQLIYLSPGDSKAALASGAVDAWATWGSFIGLEQLHGGGRVVADGSGVLSNYGFQASTDAAIRTKRELLADFLHRLAEAQQWEGGHVQDYAAVLAKETGLPADVALDTVRKYKPEVVETTPAVVSDEQTVLKQFVDAGVIAKAPPTTGAFDASFNASLSH
jgi:sulfonate transport system substrate-binding protein